MLQGFIDSHSNELSIHRRLRSDGRTFGEAAEFIRHSAVEHLYFFRNNQQIARFKGTAQYVNPAESSLMLMKDSVV
ncbi:MAG: hypothetical protein MUD08_05000 [Cytophagales bacterium]|jgi:hypothetical protein|nr:hypothetical protein [Cytophagales bacterium]